MPRPVTLFTGQWADLPFEVLCQKASAFGYDGLEIACQGDHFEVDKALASDSYIPQKRAMLEKYGLKVFAISNHLVGQAVCDRIDERHKSILPDAVWGDGKEDGVRRRAVAGNESTPPGPRPSWASKWCPASPVLRSGRTCIPSRRCRPGGSSAVTPSSPRCGCPFWTPSRAGCELCPRSPPHRDRL